MSLRQPSPPDKVFGAYWAAMANDGRPPCFEDQAEAGWWKMRFVKRGPWVPVRIWLEQEIGDDGELLSPEVLKCTVDGEVRDPLEIWTRCWDRPIAEHEFRYLTDLRAWQRVHEPEAWDPYKAVDMTETAIEE